MADTKACFTKEDVTYLLDKWLESQKLTEQALGLCDKYKAVCVECEGKAAKALSKGVAIGGATAIFGSILGYGIGLAIQRLLA